MNSILRDIVTTQFKAPKHRVCTVEWKGVDIDCKYEVVGKYLPATEDMPAEYPMAELVAAEIGGVDVLPMIYDMEWQGEIELEIEHREIRK